MSSGSAWWLRSIPCAAGSPMSRRGPGPGGSATSEQPRRPSEEPAISAWTILESVRDDFRLAWRGLTRARSFSAAAILTLALGISGTTLMFALVRGVLLRPLPVRDQDRLILAWKELPSSGLSHHPFGDAEIEDAERAS